MKTQIMMSRGTALKSLKMSSLRNQKISLNWCCQQLEKIMWTLLGPPDYQPPFRSPLLILCTCQNQGRAKKLSGPWNIEHKKGTMQWFLQAKYGLEVEGKIFKAFLDAFKHPCFGKKLFALCSKPCCDKCGDVMVGSNPFFVTWRASPIIKRSYAAIAGIPTIKTSFLT